MNSLRFHIGMTKQTGPVHGSNLVAPIRSGLAS
jgi:hypothetical protein